MILIYMHEIISLNYNLLFIINFRHLFVSLLFDKEKKIKK